MKQTNRVRISKFSLSKDILIVALQRENEQLTRKVNQLEEENHQFREALELAHRKIKGVAKQLSYFAGAKIEE